jgi:hypothetical protein
VCFLLNFFAFFIIEDVKFKRKKRYLVFGVMVIWLLAGWPVLWQNPRIPPEVGKVHATAQTFTTSGFWQAPTGVTSVTVECWGGGGVGGKGGGNFQGGGGGAGGQYVIKIVAVTLGNNYAYVVGTGGGATSGDGGYVDGGVFLRR